MAYVSFVGELPPPKRGRVSSPEHDAITAKLRQRPGEWALVLRNKWPSVASSMRQGKLASYRPTGAYEVATRARNKGRVDIYARYVGEPVAVNPTTPRTTSKPRAKRGRRP